MNGTRDMHGLNTDNLATPLRQIRAVYDETTIRIYQAYSDGVADAALANGTFISPPFKMERMTWIKPSFLWMMYRAGWGHKDDNQKRILAIDISRTGFEWALEHSCLSHEGVTMNKDTWSAKKVAAPVRIQWDPERDLLLQPRAQRSIQIGLSKEAVHLYVNEWVTRITDITDLAHAVNVLVQSNQIAQAQALLPKELDYPVSSHLATTIQLSS